MSLWVWASLAAALAQTGRNAAQSGLTRTLGTLGATNVRFLFGLPFAALFLALTVAVTGEAVPALTGPTVRYVWLFVEFMVTRATWMSGVTFKSPLTACSVMSSRAFSFEVY